MPNRLDYLTFLSNINERCLEEKFQCLKIEFENGKVSNRSKLTLRCFACGRIMSKRYTQLVNMRQGCRDCKYKVMAKKQTLDENFVISDINKRLKEEGLTFDSFEGGKYISKKKTKIYVKCSKCGKLSKSTYSEIYTGGLKCRYCHNKQYNEEEIKEIINNICIKANLTFLGFKEGKYLHQLGSTSILKCNNCGRNFSMYTHYLINHFKSCPACTKASSLEQDMMDFLDKNEIEYIYQYRDKFLGRQSLDFYLPKLNVAIECQGGQHFEDKKMFGDFKLRQERDEKKKKLCEENGMKIFYYSTYKKEEKFLGEKNYTNLEELLEDIKNLVE